MKQEFHIKKVKERLRILDYYRLEKIVAAYSALTLGKRPKRLVSEDIRDAPSQLCIMRIPYMGVTGML